MKRIFLVIPRRASVRYLLSLGLIDVLKKSNVEVIILTPITDQRFIDEYKNVAKIESIPLRDGKEKCLERFFRILRNYLGIAHFDLETIDNIIHYESDLKWLLYRLMVYGLKPFFFLQRLLRWVDLNYVSVRFDGDYETLFDKYNPDLVLVHSVYELTSIPVSRVSKRKKIPVVGIVYSWDNLSNKGEMFGYYDQLIVWNEMMKVYATKFHRFSVDNVKIVGGTQFDYYRIFNEQIETKEEFFSRKKIDVDKKLIVYTTVPKRIGGDDEIIAIQSICDALANGMLGKAQLLIRVYTRDDPGRYKIFEGLDDVILDLPVRLFEDKRDSFTQEDIRFSLDLAATVKYADVLVNIASTTSLDAAIFNTPIINIAFAKHKYWYKTGHYKLLISTDGIKLADDRQQLISLIKNYLENPLAENMERKRIVDEFCWRVDGHSIDRIAKIIIEQLNK